jgi:hypothetical protein
MIVWNIPVFRTGAVKTLPKIVQATKEFAPLRILPILELTFSYEPQRNLKKRMKIL